MGEGSSLGCQAPGGGGAVIKRPLSDQFHQKVLDGIKVSTIRPNPWPVNVPIQLFRWEGLPYRSKHVNGPAVIARSADRIMIASDAAGVISYHLAGDDLRHAITDLYVIEGFDSQEKMDDWFRRLVKPGQTIQSYQMLFSLIKP
jgi:hypothetical protein